MSIPFYPLLRCLFIVIIIIIIIADHWWLSLFLKSNSDNATLSEGKPVSKTAQGLFAESMTSASHSRSFNQSQENLPADKFYKGQQPWECALSLQELQPREVPPVTGWRAQQFLQTFDATLVRPKARQEGTSSTLLTQHLWTVAHGRDLTNVLISPQHLSSHSQPSSLPPGHRQEFQNLRESVPSEWHKRKRRKGRMRLVTADSWWG